MKQKSVFKVCSGVMKMSEYSNGIVYNSEKQNVSVHKVFSNLFNKQKKEER